MEFSTSQKGNTVLLYRGFEYLYFRTINGVLTWRCRQSRLIRCQSNMKTKDDKIVQEPTEHCHDSCPKKTKTNAARSTRKYNMGPAARPGPSRKSLTLSGNDFELIVQLAAQEAVLAIRGAEAASATPKVEAPATSLEVPAPVTSPKVPATATAPKAPDPATSPKAPAPATSLKAPTPASSPKVTAPTPTAGSPPVGAPPVIASPAEPLPQFNPAFFAALRPPPGRGMDLPADDKVYALGAELLAVANAEKIQGRDLQDAWTILFLLSEWKSISEASKFYAFNRARMLVAAATFGWHCAIQL